MPLRRLPVVQPAAGALWSSETQSLIDRGAILPFVSNYLLPAMFSDDPTDLAAGWAEDIGSPLSDQENRNLARVAQFYSVKINSVRKARFEYHNALKCYFLALAKEDPEADSEYIEGLERDPERLLAESLSEIARNLGYPRFDNPTRDPLRLLAELPLPIYVTTCQHTFLEVALSNTGSKQPETAIFYWDDSHAGIPSIYERESDYRPSVARPLVYHLFGVDTYPESMVVSEDDYVSVLMRLSELKREVKVSEYGRGGMGGAKFDIPSDIKTALSGSGLLLLGYSVDEWDFRVLFSWLVRYIGPSREGRSAPEAFCMQVRPQRGEEIMEEKNRQVEEYLRNFFQQKSFTVYWGDPETCVRDLWSRWKRS